VEDVVDIIEVLPDESTHLIVVGDSFVSAQEIFKLA
jgi:hypothetical protein